MTHHLISNLQWGLCTHGVLHSYDATSSCIFNLLFIKVAGKLGEWERSSVIWSLVLPDLLLIQRLCFSCKPHSTSMRKLIRCRQRIERFVRSITWYEDDYIQITTQSKLERNLVLRRFLSASLSSMVGFPISTHLLHRSHMWKKAKQSSYTC